MESLKDKTEAEICKMVPGSLAGSLQRQDLRRLTKALQHLKKYTDVLMHESGSTDHPPHPGGPIPGPDPKLELYWDSWTRDSDEPVGES